MNQTENAREAYLVQAQTYEITFLGQAGTTLRAEFDDCQVTIGPGTTTLRAELPDRGALSGLMERINGLGLDVIDVSLVAPPVEHLPARVTRRGVMTRVPADRNTWRHGRTSVQLAAEMWCRCSDWRAG